MQILPQEKNLGSFLGQSLGQPLQQGLSTALQQQYQRGQLQKALQEAKGVIGQPGSSRLDQMLALMQAGAGIPGSEKYLSVLLPEILKASASQDIFGLSPRVQNVTPSMQASQMQTNAMPGAEKPTISQGLPQPQEPTTAGVLPRVMPAAEIEARSQSNAISENDPSRASFWQQYYQNQNQIAQGQIQAAEKKAEEQGIQPAELPEFMQIGQRYGYMQNLNDWAAATSRDFKKYKDAKTQLDATFVPGFFSGLIKGPEYREEALNNLSQPVQAIVSMGQEPYARQKLASEGLSRTEIEGLIHPLPEKTKLSLKNLPNGPFKEEKERKKELSQFAITPQKPIQEKTLKTYDELKKTSPQSIDRMNDMLANWLKKNVTEDMSLSVLRHKIWNDKHYDWRQFSSAMAKAQEKGLVLSADQQAELAEIATQPPRQSLSDIFMDWGRWLDYIKGVK